MTDFLELCMYILPLMQPSKAFSLANQSPHTLRESAWLALCVFFRPPQKEKGQEEIFSFLEIDEIG